MDATADTIVTTPTEIHVHTPSDERTKATLAVGGLAIVRKLGQGGAGDVYEVENDEGVRYVAKTLRPEVRSTVDLIRFRREAQFMSKLHHPNLMPIVRLSLETDPPYYLMPLREGRTLHERAREPMELGFILRTMRDVCFGLAAAHRFGIVHRDVKPANIFIDEDGRAVLMDFGLSRKVDSDEELTGSNTMLGTPGYMAPEQWNGERARQPADVYALGVTIVELCLGANPFTGRSLLDVFGLHAEARPRHLDALMPGRVPLELGELVFRMLAKKPEHRPKTESCLETLAGLVRQAERQRSRPVFHGVDQAALDGFFAPPARSP
jgi:serine/threonine protein kinase